MSKNLDSLSLNKPASKEANLEAADAIIASLSLPSGVAPSTITATPPAPAKRGRGASLLPEAKREVPKLERLAVDIPADLHAAIKMHAAQNNSTIRDDVAKILAEVYADVIKGMRR